MITFFYYIYFTIYVVEPETHTIRDRRPTSTACPACWAMETTVRKKIFCTGPTRAAKAEDKSLVQASQTIEPTKEGLLSFVVCSLSTLSLSFNSQQRPPLSSLSVWNSEKNEGHFITQFCPFFMQNTTIFILQKVAISDGYYYKM